MTEIWQYDWDLTALLTSANVTTLLKYDKMAEQMTDNMIENMANNMGD